MLTDAEFFQGSLDDLERTRRRPGSPSCAKISPFDPCHVIEAAARGADAILLIAAILSDSELRDFTRTAETFRMAALVEVHDRR